MTLMPAGIATVGSASIISLQQLGLGLDQSVAIVTLVRFSTVAILLMVSFCFLIREMIIAQTTNNERSDVHFDAIASEYKNQFAEHVWDNLIERKIQLIIEALSKSSQQAGNGLDLGCGLGRQCMEMGNRGYDVIGIDVSLGLLTVARKKGAIVVLGDAKTLPFEDNSLEFVYSIGVLHHLPDKATQKQVCNEVFRILKPGGLFIIHETNPMNPFFKFYMSYIFPLLKSIDEGTEKWIHPDEWQNFQGTNLVERRFFTFMPDFIPKFLMPPFLSLQIKLEGSRYNNYSVHYMAVVQKEI